MTSELHTVCYMKIIMNDATTMLLIETIVDFIAGLICKHYETIAF